MRASIRNFRGAVSADITLSGITLLAGANGQGKSSVCEAVGAALTSHAIPLMKPGTKPGEYKPLFAKKDAAALINGGQKGSVTVETAQGKATVNWPDCEYETEGAAPGASVFAAHLIDPLELSDKERAALLSEALGALPGREDLENALRKAGFKWDEEAPEDKNVVARIWKSIEIDGWDHTHDEMKKHGAKLKGQWEECASKVSEERIKYGTTKAQDWTPEGWEEDLAKADFDKLYAEVASAKADLEHEFGSQALSADELQRLQQIVDARPSDEDLAAAKATVEEAEAAHQQALNEREKLPRRVDESGYTVWPCPHCGEKVQVKSDGGTMKVIAPEPRPTSAEIKDLRMKIADADGEVGNKEMAMGAARRKHRELKDALADAIEAEKKIEERASAGSDEGAVQAARERVETAERRLAMFEAWRECAKRHRAILNNQCAIDVLAPSGIRQQKLHKALTDFNEKYCKKLCRVAGWRQVSIDEEMLPTMAGRNWRLLCASEKWRARIVLQIALADLDKSSLVIFDGADILDKKNRNGLFKMLKEVNIPALVAMTMNKPEIVPDLQKAGMGRSYWIEDGSVDAIGEQEEAA